jgi:hypothetical protein
MGEQTKRGKISAYKCNGASNHSDVEREINDFYATPGIAIKPLIDFLTENYPSIKGECVWEPACGMGHISKALAATGIQVISTDLIDRGYGSTGDEYDFLSDDVTATGMHIITNPPYKYAQEFVEKALDIMINGKLCCMLMKLTFLEGKKRFDMFKKYPPKHLLVFSNRINCALGGDFDKTPALGGAVAYGCIFGKRGIQVKQ